ncbi:MAG: RHS repeat protein [Deltaproteobacteria bacterium]|nr:RHS repeat protein [Deltaproteobacteria bacterium]MBW1924671.1 RHS repeat protein [Deltaproteobacteria bacterium]MBW1948116.1 RHS repeat protein [Deltaproteobacteria bacterium]MBW2008231.1 RHS repeat protein [Deltaproteobacteria bacterium]MBW2101974.1 RHS repeat protein [Deltaproteobacteria bacterium]
MARKKRNAVYGFLLWLMFASSVYAGTITYQYDRLNRLTRVEYPDGMSIRYTYDLSGNRTLLEVTMDEDHDGLVNSLEDTICTDPGDADTDDDGILDGIEDANHNGIVDTDETDPCNMDTDGDGVQDGTEIGMTLSDIGPDTDQSNFKPDDDPSINTSPIDPDTDGDGMDDGWEECYALNPTVDDAFADSDGDGFSNIREYLFQTDPVDSEDIPPVEADFDGDEDSDGVDLRSFVMEFNGVECSADNPCDCDLDGDGDVDIVDLVFFTEDFGRSK